MIGRVDRRHHRSRCRAYNGVDVGTDQRVLENTSKFSFAIIWPKDDVDCSSAIGVFRERAHLGARRLSCMVWQNQSEVGVCTLEIGERRPMLANTAMSGTRFLLVRRRSLSRRTVFVHLLVKNGENSSEGCARVSPHQPIGGRVTRVACVLAEGTGKRLISPMPGIGPFEVFEPNLYKTVD